MKFTVTRSVADFRGVESTAMLLFSVSLKEFLMLIKGVIFDMDGVLVDSERLYLRFWREACASFGLELSETNGLALRSNSPEEAIPKFKAWFGETVDYMQIRELRRKLMAEHIDKYGVELKPGAAELADYLKSHGIKIALATASPIKRAEHYLSPHGLFDKFDAVVGGGMVAKGKPAPDTYICAASLLNLPCKKCMAVEDSPSGIISAHTAGCVTVMIPDLTPPQDELLPMIDYVCENLGELRNILS